MRLIFMPHFFSLRTPRRWLIAAITLAIGLGSFSCATAPSAARAGFPLFVAPRTVHSDRASLLWNKVRSDSAITYHILRDGQEIGTTTKTHFTATGLTPEHDYVFQIRATPTAGTAQLSDSAKLKTLPTEKILSVEAFGAKGDGHTLNTKALQAAIDACPLNGIVRLPAGVFLSGALFLKSDMTLEIAKDSVLQGSASPSDYEPFFLNRFEGWEMETYASLLNAGKLDRNGPATVRNITIRGEGKIAGGGDPLGKAMIAAHGMRSRGRLICLMNCSGVELQGLKLETPPCWTIHYIYSEDVSLHDLDILTNVRNGDGLDPDSSRNSYVFNCDFSTGDDCIAIKSGKNPEGNVVNRPTENVRITDCRFTRGHGISIGSEMSGGVRHVLVEDCVAGPLLYGLQIKGTKDRGGFVEDVVVRDCDLQKINILTKLNYNNDGAAAPEAPLFRNFRFENIDLTQAAPGSVVIIVNGFAAEGHRTSDVSFDHLKLPAGAITTIDQANDIRFAHLTTTDGKEPVFTVTNSERITH